jgi:ParB family chromosome partitioning protein
MASKLPSFHADQFKNINFSTPKNNSQQNTSPNTASVSSVPAPPESLISVPIDLLITEGNIRSEYDETKIKELAQSLVEYGQLQPIRVYKQGINYVIVFGHRRFLAAKEAGLTELKCIVTEKPDSLDKIFIQAIENEHAQEISSIDREEYIFLLKEKYSLQSNEIAKRIGKSTSWISQVLSSREVRLKHNEILNKGGVDITTKEAYALRNASTEEVREAVEEITSKPKERRQIITELSKRTSPSIKNKTLPKEDLPEDTPLPETEPPNFTPPPSSISVDTSIEEAIADIDHHTDIETNSDTDTVHSVEEKKEMEIKISIIKNITHNSVRLKISALGDFYDQELLDSIHKFAGSYFEKEGMTIEK